MTINGKPVEPCERDLLEMWIAGEDMVAARVLLRGYAWRAWLKAAIGRALMEAGER